MPAAIPLAIGGSAILGAGASIIAGNKAASAQKNAAKQASDTQLQMYDQTRADQAPYREVGYGALGKLAGMFGVQRMDASGKPVTVASAAGVGYNGDGGFTTSPGYEFRRSEGLKAIDRSSAARGMLNSGGADKARMRYADGLASSEYDSYSNRLAALAGVGQTSTAQTGAAGATAANGISAAQTAAGNATASAYANTGASIQKGATSLASLYMAQQGGGFGTQSAYGIQGSGGIY